MPTTATALTTDAATRPVPATMRTVEAPAFGIDALRLVERPVPRPGPGEVLVRVRAASLNYRDLVILKGVYRPDLAVALRAASDGCGEVVGLGGGVTRFRVGDRVVPTYTQGWIDGLPTPEMRAQGTLGGPLAGLLQDYVAVPAEDAVAAPAHLTDAEAATLPIAALTAWSVLQEGRVKPGDWVLVEGTGGVAVFALQLAKLAGARVVAISSSDDKLARARALGADATINYRATPEWAGPVREATAGAGSTSRSRPAARRRCRRRSPPRRSAASWAWSGSWAGSRRSSTCGGCSGRWSGSRASRSAPARASRR
jgi:NADPH:quinone reductase-like Zn-dependent oxidoreductase